MKMDKSLRKMAIFVLEDDNEGMRAALDPDSDLDRENKHLNRLLIKRHEQLLEKLRGNLQLSRDDFLDIRDANEIHVEHERSFGGLIDGHKTAARKLQAFLNGKIRN